LSIGSQGQPTNLTAAIVWLSSFCVQSSAFSLFFIKLSNIRSKQQTQDIVTSCSTCDKYTEHASTHDYNERSHATIIKTPKQPNKICAKILSVEIWPCYENLSDKKEAQQPS